MQFFLGYLLAKFLLIWSYSFFFNVKWFYNDGIVTECTISPNFVHMVRVTIFFQSNVILVCDLISAWQVSVKYDKEAYSEFSQKSKKECFSKIVDGFFRKTFHLRCLTGFWIYLCDRSLKAACSRELVSKPLWGIDS